MRPSHPGNDGSRGLMRQAFARFGETRHAGLLRSTISFRKLSASVFRSPNLEMFVAGALLQPAGVCLGHATGPVKPCEGVEGCK